MLRHSSSRILLCSAASTTTSAAAAASSSTSSTTAANTTTIPTKKIAVKNAVVEMDGDEMAKVIFSLVRDKLVLPFVDIKTEYFDLGIHNRDASNDVVTNLASDAVQHYNVGIKCATITPDEERSAEFNLKKMWKSANATLRNRLNATLFREPILVPDFPRPIPAWTSPIIVARHGRGDQHQSFDSRCGSGKVEIIFTPLDGGAPKRIEVGEVKGEKGGVVLCSFSENESIEAFAKTTFDLALQRKMPCVLSTKNTLNRQYDGLFVKVFESTFEKLYKSKFDSAKITFEHRLIDDQVAQAIKSKGGFVWALKNYDGDVHADMVSQGFGSPGLVSSIMMCADGKTMISEVGHGTVTRHFRDHQKGKETSVNSMATIFAWSKGLAQRGRLDENMDLLNFADRLEKAAIATISNDNIMTKDLAMLKYGVDKEGLLKKEYYKSTEQFVDAVCQKMMAGNEAVSASKTSEKDSSSSSKSKKK